MRLLKLFKVSSTVLSLQALNYTELPLSAKISTKVKIESSGLME
jgi:hypothetical protein